MLCSYASYKLSAVMHIINVMQLCKLQTFYSYAYNKCYAAMSYKLSAVMHIINVMQLCKLHTCAIMHVINVMQLCKPQTFCSYAYNKCYAAKQATNFLHLCI